jgi:phosphatidylglycerophosphate synthase
VAVFFPFAPVEWRLGLVLAGGASDAIDGFVARRLHATTWLGALLDGIADKVFTLAVIVTLTLDGPLTLPQLGGLLARDLVIAAIALYVGFVGRWSLFRRVAARTSGKMTTLVLFAAVAALLWRPSIGEPLVWVAIVASMGAAVDYAVVFARWHASDVVPAYLPPEERRPPEEP